mgnify:FL=1
MILELVPVTCNETLDMGLQVTRNFVVCIDQTIGGQESVFLYTGEIHHGDWNCHVVTVFVVREYLESNDGVLGQDNLTIILFLEGEHIVIGFGFDQGGHCWKYNGIRVYLSVICYDDMRRVDLITYTVRVNFKRVFFGVLAFDIRTV